MMTTNDSFKTVNSVLITIILSLIALTTAIGNIIVLLAFHCDKKLRTVNDYFIMNMAIADFLVGFFCIPFYIPFSVTRSWSFGRLFCKIWVTIDDVATMASVINIVAISVNRYWSIAYPISYRKYAKQHLVYLVMVAVWGFSFVNFAPGIWLMNSLNKTEENRETCSGDYNHSFVYMLIAQLNYFIWPFFVLCILNILIMLNIWKRTRKMTSCRLYESPRANPKRSDAITKPQIENSNRLPGHQACQVNLADYESQNLSFIDRSSPIRCQLLRMKNKFAVNCQESPTNTTNFTETYTPNHPRKHQNNENINSTNATPNLVCTASRDDPSPPKMGLPAKSPSLKYKFIRKYPNDPITQDDLAKEIHATKPMNDEKKIKHGACKRDARIRRDRRAARSLFILVMIFLIFLFPYVICATATTAGFKISDAVFEVSFWLLWLNSTCNPFLYPFIQIKYRRAYVKLFQCCLKRFKFT